MTDKSTSWPAESDTSRTPSPADEIRSTADVSGPSSSSSSSHAQRHNVDWRRGVSSPSAYLAPPPTYFLAPASLNTAPPYDDSYWRASAMFGGGGTPTASDYSDQYRSQQQQNYLHRAQPTLQQQQQLLSLLSQSYAPPLHTRQNATIAMSHSSDASHQRHRRRTAPLQQQQPPPRSAEQVQDMLISSHAASPSEATWYPIASLLQPDPGWSTPASSSRTLWADPELISVWSVQPSCPKVSQPHHQPLATLWERVRSEEPFNVDVDDVQLARDLSSVWKYFVLFVSIDLEGVTAAGSLHEKLQAAIQREHCRGDQLRFFFNNPHIDRHPQILDRIVVTFTQKVTVQHVMSTSVYTVSYPLSPDVLGTEETGTAGFSFFSRRGQYVATSLHGKIVASKQHIPGRGQLILADAFRTDNEHLANASEVGHVVCDWENDYLDVGLIHLLGDLGTAGAWFTEDAVVGYMVPLMRKVVSKDVVPSEPSSFRVLVHPATCFRGAAGVGSIPGTITWVGHTECGETGSKHCWHLIVRVDVGYEIIPGQSGSAVTLVSDGRPIGMLVGRFKGDPTMAVVTPLHHIYASVNSVLGLSRKVILCRCHNGPVTVPVSRHVTKRIVDRQVCCSDTSEPYKLRLPSTGGALLGCCVSHTMSANQQVQQLASNPFSSIPADKVNSLPTSCKFW